MRRGGLLAESVLTSRERILALIEAQPGLHLREIPRHLRLSLRAIRYHLERMGEEELVIPHRTGRFERWFPAGVYSRDERALISALRVSGQRAIVSRLLRDGPMRFGSLQKEIALSSATLVRHLDRLMDAGLVLVGADRRYRLRDPDATRMHFDLYRQRFPDLLADAAQEIFAD